MVRTTEEITTRIREIERDDFFGAQIGRLAERLTFEQVGPWLQDGVKEAEWSGPTKASPEDDIRSYLPFAVGKAEDHRGLSAGRSIDHMRALVWLMGDEAWGSIDWDAYQNYGAPILKAVAALVEYEHDFSEEFMRMAAGEKCTPDCAEGCA